VFGHHVLVTKKVVGVFCVRFRYYFIQEELPQALEVKKQNNELQQAFGIQGFPTIYFANGGRH
jgi:thioredoxin-related protein